VSKVLVSDGEKVVFRANIRATHGGKIFGVEPCGKELTWGAMGIVRVESDKMAALWWMPGLFVLMDQLQLAPGNKSGFQGMILFIFKSALCPLCKIRYQLLQYKQTSSHYVRSPLARG
jgi:hypothetical protein